ncbi:hypothetical protein [Okeania sp. SIO2B3]|uniref:hypothetical protein n=1 Tax=Okeania sp. SIO2B3 TaxID=2607784 RepID=UPI0013C1EE75|nr:hypothetical protein [Okeania sp. SIO2B3]NET41111.1 hypothetical protein [Okeania sp. SIO2B3]
MYIVDNSGSMGECESYNTITGCETRDNPKEYPINKLKQSLSKKFKDKSLGSEEIPNQTQNILLEKIVGRKIQTGLVEVGGESGRGECNARTLQEPQLNN